MYKGLKVGALIVAAGKGERMGSGINKQFIKIGNMPVLAWTLSAFDLSDLIDFVVLVTKYDLIDECRMDIIERYNIKKVIDIIEGGEERQQSVMKGLKAVKDACNIVVIHDGARPFVTTDIIEKSIEEAYKYGASACAVPVKDTIKLVNEEGFIIDTPERSKLYAVQTPQTFRLDIVYKAHIKAIEDGYIGTDDTVLVERIGTKVKLFRGSYENIKITTPEDIYFAEAIFKLREGKRC